MEQDDDIYRPWQTALSIIYFALLGGQVMFGAIVYVLTGSDHNFVLSFSDPMTIAMIAVTCVALPAGHFVFQPFLNRAKQTDSPAEKMAIYRQGFLIRCATNEFVSLFAIVMIFLTHSFAYYLFLAISLSFFAMANPTLAKVKRQIGV